MSERIPAGALVEIRAIVLAPGMRAPAVPQDTQQVPLEMYVKGFLVHEAKIGERAEVKTPAGRQLGGTLVDPAPAYTHTFGARLAELAGIGKELRKILHRRRGSY